MPASLFGPGPIGRRADGTGQREELGADPQAGGLCGSSVHVEAHLAILDEEPNHASASREIIAFTDRENAGSRSCIENAMELLRVALDDERRAHPGERLIPLSPANDHWPVSDRLRFEKLLSGVR